MGDIAIHARRSARAAFLIALGRHGNHQGFLRARKGDVQQAAALLQLLRAFVFGHGLSAQSGTRRAGHERRIDFAFVIEQSRIVLRGALLQKRRRSRRGDRTLRRERHIRDAVDGLQRERARTPRARRHFGHGHNGEFQALARMHRHNAHEVAALGRKRAWSFLGPLDMRRQTRRAIGGAARSLRLEALDQANGLEHVAGNREAFGFFSLKAREPTRVAHGIHHNARRGLHARLLRERIDHAHRAGKLRRDIRHIALGKLPETDIEAAAAIDARGLIEARGQSNEVVGRKLEHVARKQFEKRRRRLGIGDDLGQSLHHAHLGRARKNRAARNNARETGFAQRGGVGVGVRHAAQQHHHVARGVARFAQLGETFRNAARLKSHHIRFIDSACTRVRGAQHIDAARANQERVLHLRLDARRGKRHKRFAEYLALLKNAIDEAQDVSMAAEVVGQHDGHARVVFAHVLHMAVVHRNVGAAEAIDALLGIAHRAQTLAARARHSAHHVDLQLVGVLEFVDHNELEFIGKRLANALVFLQRTRGQNEQVVVVERRHLAFLRVIRRIDLTGQTNEVAQ